MKFLRFASLALLLSGSLTAKQPGSAGINACFLKLDPPAKTIVIKNAGAENTTTFFANNNALMFEVYKVGSRKDLDEVLKTFTSDKDVESCNSGMVTGDYTQIILVLKTNKNKAWFTSMFKKAGLNTIKINTASIKSVDQM